MSYEVIAQQLGGTRKLALMISAHSFVGTNGPASVLQFKIKARALHDIKIVRIVLMPSDTYSVELMTLRGRLVKRLEDVYCDSLRRVIESETGLYLSL